MPYPMHVRDFVYKELTVRRKNGVELICSRSCVDRAGFAVKDSNARGRVRADMKLATNRLRASDYNVKKTEVTCVIDIDLGGIVAIDALNRKMYVSLARKPGEERSNEPFEHPQGPPGTV